MLQSYLTLALRNLWRNKLHTGINIAGLATGIACCLLMVLFVRDELSYDQHQVNRDRIFRLSNELILGGKGDNIAMTGLAIGPRLKAEYPEVEQAVRLMPAGNRITLSREEKRFNEQRFYLADPEVFSVLTFKWIQGNPETALADPKTLVLTESIAKKLFGDANPMNQFVRLNSTDVAITGIIKDLPANSDMPINGLLSMSTFPREARENMEEDWGRLAAYTFLLFQQAGQAEGFDAKLRTFEEKYVAPFWVENSVDGEIRYELTALADLHLRTDLNYDTPKGNRSYLYIFSLVALFILLIACINYINLAIAQSSGRSTEVGIRKVTGAGRSMLIAQFIGESLVLTLLALFGAILLVELSLPLFNDLANKAFSFGDIFSLPLIFSMLGILTVIGIGAGSYPAFYLSSLEPVEILKGKLALSGNALLRKALVVVQFTISISLIIGTLTVYEQMQHLKSQDLGFDKSQVMVVEIPSDTSLARRMPEFSFELLQNPAISKVATASGGVPGASTGALLMRLERENRLEEKTVNVMFVDDGYLDALGIELTAGRNFDRSRGTDAQQAFIINEAVARMQGWGEEALEKRVQWGLMANDSAANDGRVVGIIRDFHYASLHNEIDPLILIYSPQPGRNLLVRLEGGQIAQGRELLLEKWQAFDPLHPMEYFFLDTFFDQQYRNEEKMMAIFGYFTILTILIACMGLFGLASFLTQQRTKEIGVRKVLGAGTENILALLSREFAILVIVSIVLAIIPATIGMNYWLQDFPYRISLIRTGIPIFLLAGLLSFAIAMLVTSYHAFRAARSNPVDALRHE